MKLRHILVVLILLALPAIVETQSGPSALNFSVAMNSSGYGPAQQRLEIRGGPLKYQGLSIQPDGSPFAVEGQPGPGMILQKGQTFEWTVRFQPKAAGTYKARLEVYFSGRELDIALTGTAR